MRSLIHSWKPFEGKFVVISLVVHAAVVVPLQLDDWLQLEAGDSDSKIEVFLVKRDVPTQANQRPSDRSFSDRSSSNLQRAQQMSSGLANQMQSEHALANDAVRNHRVRKHRAVPLLRRSESPAKQPPKQAKDKTDQVLSKRASHKQLRPKKSISKKTKIDPLDESERRQPRVFAHAIEVRSAQLWSQKNRFLDIAGRKLSSHSKTDSEHLMTAQAPMPSEIKGSTDRSLNHQTAASRRQKVDGRQVLLDFPEPISVTISVTSTGSADSGSRGDAEESGGALAREHTYDPHEIEEKVARILPLVVWDWQRRGEMLGEARVLFRLNKQGYVEQLRVSDSSGSSYLDQESAPVLLLASPFEYIPGWIELKLVFRG